MNELPAHHMRTILIVHENDCPVDEWVQALRAHHYITHQAQSKADIISVIQSNDIDAILLPFAFHEQPIDLLITDIKKIQSRSRVIAYFSDEPLTTIQMAIHALPVQGYHCVHEGVIKLVITIDVVLKNLSKIDMIRTQLNTIKTQIKIIEKNKEGLRYIISAMPETINRLQPLDTFIRGVLIQLCSFIDAEHSFLATYDANQELTILVGTGVFDVSEKDFRESPHVAKRLSGIEQVRAQHAPCINPQSAFFPLMAEDRIIGIFYLEKKAGELKELEIEMLRLFASQVAITIENSNLFKLATVDGLTGLYVRRYFLQRFQEALQLASRLGGQSLALLLFDIDHFKHINDSFGHPEGDKILASVSQLIRESVRVTDIPGRLGGEEFAVLLLDTEGEHAYQLAESIRKKIENHAYIIQNNPHKVTISIGISAVTNYTIDTTHAKEKNINDIVSFDMRKMLQAADKALYQSKDEGRNRVTVADMLTT